MENKKRSKYWDRMVDIIDEHFPKGKSKERGAALVMLAYIEMMLQEEDKPHMGGSGGSRNTESCPPHNFIPFQYEGGWGASVPPPNMKCTKCLSTERF